MENIKISVILPVYNTEEFLDECLTTLINQSLEDIEIICINDGSTDNSLDILEEYAKKDNRIIIINQENHNAGYSRNQGIKIAKGEYLSFLDADDFFDVNMLEFAYHQAKSQEADICIYKSYLYDNNTGKSHINTWSVKEDYLPTTPVFNHKDINSNIFTSLMCWAWDKLFKRSFIIENKILFQEQRTTNDMYFVFSSLLKADKMTILNKQLYYQRRNVSSSLSNSREKSWDCFYNALKKLQKQLVDMNLYEKYRKHFVNYSLQTCLWNLNTLKEPIARQLYEKLVNEWFVSLDIKHQYCSFFENKNEYMQYLLITGFSIDDIEAYELYQICHRQRINIFKNSNAKLHVDLNKEEKLRITEMYDRLTLI